MNNMQSEVVDAAVPVAADAWTAVGTFVVPAGVERIRKVLVSVAPDFGATADIRFAPVFRLLGSGLLEQSPHEYVGPCGNATLATSGSGAVEPNNIEYDVDIPVQTGGTIDAQINTLDEIITAGTARVGLVYDVGAPETPNSQSQYVDAALTTVADVWAAVGTLTVPRMAEGASPTKIIKVVMAMATDQAALALLRCSGHFRLSGSGLNEGGTHEFLGPASGSTAATPGVVVYDRQTVSLDIEIPVNAGGQILVEQFLDTETPTAGTAICGLMYN